MFVKASRRRARLHMALIGPAGSGKTYTALRVGCALGRRVALIDTERSSSCNYAELFDFDVCELESHHPQRYVEAIRAAEAAGYDVLIIDSLSHAWAGKDGALALVDAATRRSKSRNGFAAWREVTPLHNELVDAILSPKCHVITTIRAKMGYVQEKDDKGRTRIRKVGMKPLQRDGMEYEFDIVGDMDIDNYLVITKSRCPELKGAVIHQPGEPFAEVIKSWFDSDGGPPERPAAPAPTPAVERADPALVRRLPERAPAPTGPPPGRAVAEPAQEPPMSALPLNQDPFTVALKAAGFEAKLVGLFFVEKGRGDPSTWPEGRRRLALQWLQSEAGRANYRAWMEASGLTGFKKGA